MHTPGPWEDWKNGFIRSIGRKWAVARAFMPISGCKKEFEANKKLIKAAPDLLEACKVALKRTPFPVGHTRLKEMLEDAIAKAEGQG